MSWFVKMMHFDYKYEEEYKFEKRGLKLSPNSFTGFLNI